MDNTTTFFLALGLLVLGAGAYLLTRPTILSSTSSSPVLGPPASVPITNGSTAKTLECVGGAVAGAAGASSVGVPAPVGATLGCTLAPYAVKVATTIARDTASVAESAAKATGRAAKTAYNDTVGKIISIF